MLPIEKIKVNEELRKLGVCDENQFSRSFLSIVPKFLIFLVVKEKKMASFEIPRKKLMTTQSTDSTFFQTIAICKEIQ